MVTHVLYIHTASLAECEVTCGHTGMLPGGGIPGRGSMGALEPALLFSPHSDSGLRTVAPSLSLVSLPAELKETVFVAFYALVPIWTPQHSFEYSCTQNGLSHREVGLCLGKFAWNRNQSLQPHRRIQGWKLQGIIMKKKGIVWELRDMPSALGLKTLHGICRGWLSWVVLAESCACGCLCMWELVVHVGVCARGHSGHPVPTTDSRYKLMGSVGSLVAGYLVLMPKTNFK